MGKIKTLLFFLGLYKIKPGDEVEAIVGYTTKFIRGKVSTVNKSYCWIDVHKDGQLIKTFTATFGNSIIKIIK